MERLDYCSQWSWLADINSNYWSGSLIDLDPKRQTGLKPKGGLTWIETITERHLNRLINSYTPKNRHW